MRGESLVCPHGIPNGGNGVCFKCKQELDAKKVQNGESPYYCAHGVRRENCRQCAAEKSAAVRKHSRELRNTIIKELDSLISFTDNPGFNRDDKTCLHGVYPATDCDACLTEAVKQAAEVKEVFLAELADLDSNLDTNFRDYQDAENFINPDDAYREKLGSLWEKTKNKLIELGDRFFEN